MVVIEAGKTALVLSKTYIESPGKSNSEYSSERDAIYVYKKDVAGKWRCVIDNSYGVELLGLGKNA
jgi:ketosteroid isomerase-like protein